MGRNACSVLLVIDAQSANNMDTAELKCNGTSKKVFGIKSPITFDTLGLTHALALNTVQVTELKGALHALQTGPNRVQRVLCNSGSLYLVRRKKPLMLAPTF